MISDRSVILLVLACTYKMAKNYSEHRFYYNPQEPLLAITKFSQLLQYFSLLALSVFYLLLLNCNMQNCNALLKNNTLIESILTAETYYVHNFMIV